MPEFNQTLNSEGSTLQWVKGGGVTINGKDRLGPERITSGNKP